MRIAIIFDPRKEKSIAVVQNLKVLSDKTLIENTDRLVQSEREILVEVLRHLQEIDRRKLFSELGYPSLFEYAKQRLKYSEDQAYRRIAVMRLLREVPEIETKIDSGSLTLAHLNMAQTLFKKEKTISDTRFAKSEKLGLLCQLEGKSTRAAEKIVIQMASSPATLAREKIRPISQNFLEFKFTAPEELELKILRLKGLLAHKHPLLSTAELIDLLCDVGLEKWDPMQQAAATRKRRVPQRSGNIALAGALN